MALFNFILRADPIFLRRMDQLERALDYMMERFETMAIDLTRVLADLQAEREAIAAETAAVNAAVGTIQSLGQQLRDALANVVDPGVQAQLADIATQIEGNITAINAATATLTVAVTPQPVIETAPDLTPPVGE